MASAPPPNGRGCFEESSVGRYKILSWKILAARPWTILARDNVARLSSTASCDTVSFNGTRTTRRGTIEGWGDILGTAPFLPPLSLSLEAPSTKRVRLFSRFCRDSSDPFVRFQCLAFELDSSFPSCPTPNVLAPETEGRYIARGEL